MSKAQVRVLKYTGTPGDVTTPDNQPDSVMYALSSFRRRLHAHEAIGDVVTEAGQIVSSDRPRPVGGSSAACSPRRC